MLSSKMGASIPSNVSCVLLCLVVWILLKMGFVHKERRWRHMLAACKGQRFETPGGLVGQIGCFLCLPYILYIVF